MVSIMGDYFFEFPQKTGRKYKLLNFLDDKADEKYYISKKGVEYVTKDRRIQSKFTQMNCLDEESNDTAIPVTAVGQQNWTGDFVCSQTDNAERERSAGRCEKVEEEALTDTVGISCPRGILKMKDISIANTVLASDAKHLPGYEKQFSNGVREWQN